MRIVFAAAVLAGATSAAGDRAARLYDSAIASVAIPEANADQIRACLASARGELADAFNDHRSEEVLKSEVEFKISRCLDGGATTARAEAPSTGAPGASATVEAASPAAEPGVEEAPVAETAPEPAATTVSASAQAATAAEPSLEADPAVVREFLSWYLCEVCQRIVDKGVALRKSARKSSDRAALQEAQKQIAAGTQCGKYSVSEFRKVKSKPYACNAPAISAVTRCLATEPGSADARCRAFQAKSAAMPAAASFAQ